MQVEHFVNVEVEVKMTMTLDEAQDLRKYLEYHQVPGKELAMQLKTSLAELPTRLASE